MVWVCDQATRNIGTYNNAWQCRRAETQRSTQTYLAGRYQQVDWPFHHKHHESNGETRSLEKEDDDIKVPQRSSSHGNNVT